MSIVDRLTQLEKSLDILGILGDPDAAPCGLPAAWCGDDGQGGIVGPPPGETLTSGQGLVLAEFAAMGDSVPFCE